MFSGSIQLISHCQGPHLVSVYATLLILLFYSPSISSPLSLWPHIAFLPRQMIVQLFYNHMCTCSCTPKVERDNKSCPEGTFCQITLNAHRVLQRQYLCTTKENTRKNKTRWIWGLCFEQANWFCCQQIELVGFYLEIHEYTSVFTHCFGTWFIFMGLMKRKINVGNS